jgi:hypothetical protein
MTIVGVFCHVHVHVRALAKALDPSFGLQGVGCSVCYCQRRAADPFLARVARIQVLHNELSSALAYSNTQGKKYLEMPSQNGRDL